MENASKALIIAGAILLAILIISLGIVIYQQAKGAINENAMSQVEMTQFNTQFTQYQGRQRGSTIRALYQAVLANNVSQDSNDRRVAINAGNGMNTTINLGKTATQLPAGVANINTGSTYEVVIVYGQQGTSNAGLVDSITINAVTQNNQ